MSPVERSGSSKAKTVLFTAPTYYAHSATGETEDEYDDEEGEEYDDEMMDQQEGEGVEYEDDEEVDENGMTRREFEEEEERQRQEIAKQQGRQQDGSEFSEDEGEMDQGTPILEEDRRGAPAAGAAVRRNSLYNNDIVGGGPHRHIEDDGNLAGDEDEEEQEKQSHWEREREHAVAAQQQAAMAEAQWAKDREQQARRALSPQQQNQNQSPPQAVRSLNDGTLSTSTSSSSVRRAIDENDFSPNVPTKKLTVTPSIVRDPTFDFDNPHADQTPISPIRSDSIKSASPTTPSYPNRVRGVEIVDPRDPKFNRMLQPTLKAGEETLYEHVSRRSVDSSNNHGHQGNDADLSLNSMDTATTVSSIISNGSSNDGAPATLTKKQKRQSGESGEGDKKRKSGGILGLFRKKDKKNKKGGKEDSEGNEPRSSEDSARRNGSASPSSPRGSAERGPGQGGGGGAGSSKRDSVSAESMFSTDAALRQQELEAKQALYHQYGVHRGPGDITNTMAPRPAPASVSMTNSGSRNSLQLLNPSSAAANGPRSPSYDSSGQRIRPGSLMGSPSIPGLEVPLLSVLRVFAGEQVEAEATFKTVLLNQSTTASDLVKQAMQRFRLTGYELTEEFFLTVKELGGEERPLNDDERPLAIFEELSEKAGADSTFAVPSVKRSSVGSINSISSNLSLNPAITRLGMNDWSDDSAVKFYLNRRLPTTSDAALDESTGRTSFSERESISADSITQSALTPNSSSQTSYRFAVRLLIHPSDLPENVVFDPQSNAIIPKNVLQERQQRNGSNPDSSLDVSPNAREKIVFFPKNANVSDVIEAGLDRFGIVDGVVDGGDEVEDRVSRRRSVTRVKYSLAVDRDGKGKRILYVSHCLSLRSIAIADPSISMPSQKLFSMLRRNFLTLTRLPQLSSPTIVLQKSSKEGLWTLLSSSVRKETFNRATPSLSFDDQLNEVLRKRMEEDLCLQKSTNSTSCSNSELEQHQPQTTLARLSPPTRNLKLLSVRLSLHNELQVERTNERSSLLRRIRIKVSTSRFPIKVQFDRAEEKTTMSGTRSSTTMEPRLISAISSRTNGSRRKVNNRNLLPKLNDLNSEFSHTSLDLDLDQEHLRNIPLERLPTPILSKLLLRHLEKRRKCFREERRRKTKTTKKPSTLSTLLRSMSISLVLVLIEE